MPQLSEQKAKLDDSEITKQEFDTWLAPFNQLVGIDLAVVQEIASLRNDTFHGAKYFSATAQKALISKVQKEVSQGIPSSLQPYSPIINAILTMLQTASFHRLK